MKKRILAMLFATIMMASFTSCSSSDAQSGSTAQPDAASAASAFPEETITIVVPFAAGGNVDLTCRIIAEELSTVLDTDVVVENREGGGAIIGQTYGLSQEADGYTILATTSSFVTNILSGDTEFKMEDATAIGQYCFDPEIIVVSADSGITTFEQFIQVAKDGSVTNSTPGFSTSHHIASLIFADQNGLNFEYMHTDGSAEQVVQLAGGHAQVGMTTYGGAATLISEGRIIPIAVCNTERSADLPDVPTLAELGYDFNYGAWRGFTVPAGTPEEVVTILSDALSEVMASEEVAQAFKDSGFPVAYLNANDFQIMMENDYENMSEIYHLLEE